MRKSLLLYLLLALSIVVIAQNIFVRSSVSDMDYGAKAINYTYRVRGETQRLVKLELARITNDELIARLDEYLVALREGNDELGIKYLDDNDFQNSLSQLIPVWHMLREGIYAYREGTGSADSLIVISEEHFKLADKAVKFAEARSSSRLSNTFTMIFASSAVTLLILLVVAVTIAVLRGWEKEQTNLLNEKNREIMMANKSKSSFLSNMSHDIRTPLNGIIGMSTVATANINDKEKVSDCLSSISGASKHLLSLLNDILDISKIEGGVLELVNELLFVPDVIKSISETAEKMARDKGLEFNIKVGELTHKYVSGDRARLNQVYMNILANAVNFTPEGGKIDVTVMEIAAVKDGFARFLVVCSDNGIGMSEAFQGRIFDPFSRELAPGNTKADTDGTGLGLPISKNLIEMMGGKLMLESKKDVGTNVTIESELLIGDPSEALEADSEHCGPFKECDFSGRHILVAEDNELNRQIVAEMFAPTKAELDFAFDGRECLDKFASSSENYYDLILMDVQMPIMTGSGATIAIRALQRSDAKTIPIVALTANVFPEDIKEVISVGMDSHIAKPFDFTTAKSIISRFIMKGRTKE